MSQAAAIIKAFEAAKADRARFEPKWRECFDHSFPLRSQGWDGTNFDSSSSNAKQAELLDSTATEAGINLASNVCGGVTPANGRWFDLDVDGSTPDERAWLSEAATSVWTNIHAANFDSAGFECALDMVAAGWFALYIDSDRERGGFHFEQWPISQVFGAASKPGGAIDKVYRRFFMTAEQAVNEFGEERVSAGVRTAAQRQSPEQFEFIHAIYPRSTYAVGAKLARNLPIASCHIEVATKHIVRERGYHEMPVVVPRWELIPNSVYGSGPMAKALPDIKMVNKVRRMELQAAALAISGMWAVKNDGVVNPHTLKVGPGKVIVTNDPANNIKPLLTGADFNVAWTTEERAQAQIRRALMADQLQAQDGPQMTATEIHVRVDMIRKLLGPVYGRMQAEYLKPLIDRCFGIMYRAGALGAAPDSLQGRVFHTKYISPFARAQKLDDVASTERYLQTVTLLAEADPEAADMVDRDEALRVIGEGVGVPARVIPSTKAIAKKRADRLAAQQQAQAQQQQAGAEEQITGAMAQRMAKQA